MSNNSEICYTHRCDPSGPLPDGVSAEISFDLTIDHSNNMDIPKFSIYHRQGDQIEAISEDNVFVDPLHTFDDDVTSTKTASKCYNISTTVHQQLSCSA
jgi:hypothetical protein